MDLNLKDRRSGGGAVATVLRLWPYIAIVVLLALLAATNLNKSETSAPSSTIVRNTLLEAKADPNAYVNGSDMMFVTWFATGGHGDGGFSTHQFDTPDMRWIDVVKKSHPGCSVAYVLDQDTQLETYEGLDVHRIDVDKTKFGRNAYNDLYHWTARYSFLEKLISEGREMYNVVYIDPDILIMQDLHSVFERDFDYLMTISENEEQPINGAMHFVPKGKYHQAVAYIKGVLSVYDLGCRWMFTCGQQAYADFAQISNNNVERRRIQDAAVRYGRSCRRIREKFEVCFVTCNEWNYWESCMDHEHQPVEPDNVADFVRIGTKVFHFVAWRKQGMQVVYEAYMKKGLMCAYHVFASLPHLEKDYKNDDTWVQRTAAVMKSC